MKKVAQKDPAMHPLQAYTSLRTVPVNSSLLVQEGE